MTQLQEIGTYSCEYVTYEDGVWDRVAPTRLVDVVTGGAVQEETLVKACWDQSALYVRFECVDTYSVSQYKNRKDPLYEQDVVEMFIDEEGDCKRYMELVVSPNGVLCDLMITHEDENDPLSFKIDRAWEVQGFEKIIEASGDRRTYTFTIPFANFSQAPMGGTEWRINFFRIDEEEGGERHYQAWSPTGVVNYHVADRFGRIRFAESKVDR
ncbi:carbohydrate-binding family 9-like protein [Cohnella silvisoli]|uniref:Carbohydrate-binding family 9-like protein n=1 Tax=Cohnella silvisoli TaxID=2873699 RepID=A0ABV1KXN5_9BACL|nr:carbohydrate-binding family 9-like protein [Cohnella silvisoli]MCD9023848.1 carbohydrate-binding family 9-like protein [Cohnella silvisoli]